MKLTTCFPLFVSRFFHSSQLEIQKMNTPLIACINYLHESTFSWIKRSLSLKMAEIFNLTLKWLRGLGIRDLRSPKKLRRKVHRLICVQLGLSLGRETKQLALNPTISPINDKRTWYWLFDAPPFSTVANIEFVFLTLFFCNVILTEQPQDTSTPNYRRKVRGC